MTAGTLLGSIAVMAEVALQILFAGLVLLRPRIRQSSSMAWILIIIAMPVLGMLLYLVIGNVRPGKERIRRYGHIVRRIHESVAEEWARHRPVELAGPYKTISLLAEVVGETQPRRGNRLSLVARTDELIASLVRDIDAARDHCHLLFYIYLSDGSGRQVAEALLSARARGVDCRLLVDAVGSAKFLDSELCRKLKAGGVRVLPALHTRYVAITTTRLDLRNHRKIAVIDGTVGYTGSHNLADASFAIKPRCAPWVDATVRIEGPAVRDLHALFIQDWFLDTGESLDGFLSIDPPEAAEGVAVQIMGTGVNYRNQALVQVIQAAIHMARDELILTTPYFVPPEGTLDALVTAAMRGVSTAIVLPRCNDSTLVALASKSFYEPLLEAGVQIFEFTRGLLHAKTMTVDRDLGLVSTANLDRRSFEINLEVSTLVYDSDFASQLRFLQRSYVADSIRVDGRTWARRSWPRRLTQNAAGLLSPLL